MIIRVCRREVSCERGWGVSLRSTTCKGMLTVPGGELRCTGNLCSERHSRPEVGERLLTINRLRNIAQLFHEEKKIKHIGHIGRIFPQTADAIFSSSAPLVSSIYDFDRNIASLCSLDRSSHADMKNEIILNDTKIYTMAIVYMNRIRYYNIFSHNDLYTSSRYRTLKYSFQVHDYRNNNTRKYVSSYIFVDIIWLERNASRHINHIRSH